MEGGDDGQFPIPEEDREDVIRTAQECDKRAKSKIACDHITNYLEAVAYVPQFNSTNCIVFDEDMFETGHVSEENEAAARKFCKPRQVRIQFIPFLYQMYDLLTLSKKAYLCD